MNVSATILAVITREFVVLNSIEAGVWIALGLGAAVQALRFGGAVQRDLVVLVLALIGFGASDIVETRTGAWWRPWWLLAWKSACVGVMLWLLVNHVRRRMRR